MASNIPDYEILEPARIVTSSIVSPRVAINYLLAMFISVLLPYLIIYLKRFLNQNITSPKDIEKVIDQPVINHIFTNHYKTEKVIAGRVFN